MCLLDLTAAFDTVDHDLLMLRLERQFGFRGVVLQWFRSYLSDRSFRVVLSTSTSFLVHLFCSVPCTRISFRSTHVILYMADLADVGELPFVCYADSQIYFHCLLSGVPSAVRKLEVSVFRPASWICS